MLLAAYLFDAFVRWPMPANALIRPLIFSVVVALLLQVALTGITRRPHLAAFATAVILSLVFNLRVVLVGLLVLGGLVMAVSLWLERRDASRTPTRLANLTSAGRFLTIVMLLLTIVTAFGSGAFRLEELLFLQVRTANREATTAVPDIYVVLLDGYPRGDTLADAGFDNERFFSDLESRGFFVDSRSESNYAKTWFTVTSFFQMRHLVDLDITGISTPADEIRAANRALNDAPSLELLAEHGYEVVSVPPPFADVQLWDVADRHTASYLNTFEMGLLESHAPAGVARWLGETLFADHARRWNVDAFRKLAEIAATPHPAPRFVFVHVAAPHSPALLADGGSQPFRSACFPETCTFHEHDAEALGLSPSEFWASYADQVEWTNARVLESIDVIARNSPDAVVVLLSDHGSRWAPADDPDERFKNFFAARTPGHDGLFEVGTTPVTVLARLFNAYLDTDLPVAPDDRYEGDLPDLERLDD